MSARAGTTADTPTGSGRPPADASPRDSASVVRSSIVVGAGTAISRITGFLRITAMAAIGFGGLTDAYNIANQTPNVVYELLLGGILTATLVPLFVEHLARRDDDAVDAINTVAVVALAVITVVGIVAAPWIIRLYTLRLHGHDRVAQQALGTALLRLFMPQVFFYGLAALVSAMLNARRRFAAAALAPAVNNVIVIVVFVALPHLTHRRLTVDTVRHSTALVWWLGAGTTLGIVAMALVLLPALRGAGLRLRFTRRWRNPAIAQLARLSGWTVGYVVANQVAFWIALFLSYGHSGDASVYVAAFTFFQLPHGLFAVSIMTALIPELAAAASAGDLARFRRQFAAGLRFMAVVVLPAAVLMVVLARPGVNAVLDYGAFSTHSADRTAATLAAFGLGLFFFSTYLYVLRGFYALQDTRTPFFLNVVENLINIVLALALYPFLGVVGLALSWSVAYAVAAVLAALALRRRLRGFDGARTLRTVVRIAVASVLLGVTAWAVPAALGYGTSPRAVLAVLLALAGGGALYLGALRRMRVHEIALLVRALRRPTPTATTPIVGA